MTTILLIIGIILLFLIYCAVCVGITYLIDCLGLYLWAKVFPRDEELWNKYWWYKYSIFAYIILLTSISVFGAIKIATIIFK